MLICRRYSKKDPRFLRSCFAISEKKRRRNDCIFYHRLVFLQMWFEKQNLDVDVMFVKHLQRVRWIFLLLIQWNNSHVFRTLTEQSNPLSNNVIHEERIVVQRISTIRIYEGKQTDKVRIFNPLRQEPRSSLVAQTWRCKLLKTMITIAAPARLRVGGFIGGKWNGQRRDKCLRPFLPSFTGHKRRVTHHYPSLKRCETLPPRQ